MNMFKKLWVPLIAIGLMACLAAPPGIAAAGDLLKEASTALTEAEELIAGDDHTASTDGTEGDPDTLTDDLNAHGSYLQELSGMANLSDEDTISLENFLVRMIPWTWLF